jgi:nucleoside-diphosphate-sugar epimerase
VPIGEECGFHPASPYAISKVGTDLLGRYYAEAFGMTVMTTRMFTHTGWAPEIPYERTMRDILDYWRGRVGREGALLAR